MTTPDAEQAKPSSRNDSDVNTRLIEDLRAGAATLCEEDIRWAGLLECAALEIERLRGVEDALRWIRNDLSYRPPEQIDPDIRDHIFARIDAASRSTGAADVGEDRG